MDESSVQISAEDPILQRLESDEDETDTDSEEDFEPRPGDPRWEDADEQWNPNWLKNYDEEEGLSMHYPGGLTDPSEFFLLLFDNEVIGLLVEQTNLYAEQFFAQNPLLRGLKYYSQWEAVTVPQFKAYLGILIHMGLVRFPRLQCHWESSEQYNCCFCPSVMTRQEFTLIHKFFHIVDNQRLNQDDRLAKIRPLLDLLITKYQRYYVLSRNLTIDERMVKYTGRLSFRQHIRNKPIRQGIKIFVLADTLNGYVYNWEVYCGAREGREVGLAENVVMRLVGGLHNLGHVVCFDSYYTSVPLAKYLASRGFGCLGMIRANRRFLPQTVKNPPDILQEGEGYYKRAGNMLCFVYKDNRRIRMLTNVYGIALQENGRPQALNDYNFLMRGVDKSNQNISYYRFKHKSIKWYRTLFISALETTICNSFQLYRLRFPTTGKNTLKFREALSTELAQEYLTLQHEQIRMGPPERIILGLHEIGIRTQKNCCICSTSDSRKTTVYYCIECDKNVCPSGCFYALHTKLKVYQRNKSKNTEDQ